VVLYVSPCAYLKEEIKDEGRIDGRNQGLEYDRIK